MKLCVDAILFGFDKDSNDLKILLIQRKYEPYKDLWALAGGFVQEKETLESAVIRELKEETGLISNPFLEQLYTFGDIDRDPRDRIVSVAYYGLINTTELKASTDAKDAKWFSVNKLPKDLAFDHNHIINKALERLRGKIIYQPIGFELLEENFTFKTLHNLYETILGETLDRRNFKKKFLSLDILDELDEKKSDGAVGRPASFFKFNKEKYDEKVKSGFYFEL
jgi:8-oxo-dGTP diphosphatase